MIKQYMGLATFDFQGGTDLLPFRLVLLSYA